MERPNGDITNADLFEAISGLSTHTDGRFDAIDRRFDAMDARLQRIEDRLGPLP